MTSEQRRRNLERRIREAETRRALLEDKILAGGTSAPPELAHELAAVEGEIADAQRELLDAAGGDIRQQAQARAVLILNQRLAETEASIKKLVERVTILEDRLNAWFTQDAHDRRAGWRIANAYRAGLAVLVVIDIIVRVLR